MRLIAGVTCVRFALISDIHANLEALRAVLASIDAEGIATIYCLGDVIGYGPEPAACVDLIMERCAFTIRGNHDHALFFGAARFNRFARAALDWTRKELQPGLFKARANTSRWQFLKELPLEQRVGRHYFVHGSPRDQVNEYIYREDAFFHADSKLAAIFAKVDHLLFVGHTHLPVIIDSEFKTWLPSSLESKFSLHPDRRYIINVGSVGQPRDRDPRACWVECDGASVTYHRVPYDIGATQKKIRRVGALDPLLGQRLADGA